MTINIVTKRCVMTIVIIMVTAIIPMFTVILHQGNTVIRTNMKP